MLLALVLITASLPVLAHKLNVFAYVEGSTIYVEAYFSDGVLPADSEVTVTNAAGNVVDSGRTNQDGEYSFTVKQVEDLNIKVNAGMGHVAEYTLGSDDVDSDAIASDEGMHASAGASTSAAQIELIKKAVAQSNKSLAREISELKNRTRLSDIVGGIGIIIGLLGFYAYMKARKELAGANRPAE
jgi:nickel transport protein